MDQFKLFDWFARRTYHHAQFAPVSKLVDAKQQAKTRISVCVPTRNECETIGSTIRLLRQTLLEGEALIDELVVMDAGSADGTAEIAAAEGAIVAIETDVLPDQSAAANKGDAIWKSLYVCTGDIVCWLDADIANLHPRFVTGVVGPLLIDPTLHYVKAFYRRPIHMPGADGAWRGSLAPSGGGRVTELLARPLLNTFWPHLAGVLQPLAGEFAGRRELLERIPFNSGHGVEVGHLIDIAREMGMDAIAQVDLERRVHRNWDLQTLSKMSFGVMQAALGHLVEEGRLLDGAWSTNLAQLAEFEGGTRIELKEITVSRRPPMTDLAAYRDRRAALT
jgi:hypothetical protein